MVDSLGGLERQLAMQQYEMDQMASQLSLANAMSAAQHRAQYESLGLLLSSKQFEDEFSSPGKWVFPPSRNEEERTRRARHYIGGLLGREISVQETLDHLRRMEPEKPKATFEDAFVYRPPVQKKKPFDWTLPLPEPWASRFTKVYLAMLAATPLYILLAIFGA